MAQSRITYPPFGANTADDRGGLLLTALILNAVFVTITLPVRVFRIGKKLELDDGIAALAAVRCGAYVALKGDCAKIRQRLSVLPSAYPYSLD